MSKDDIIGPGDSMCSHCKQLYGAHMPDCPDRCMLNPSTWPVAQAQSGWQCPGCGRCYAPNFPQCMVCGPKAEFVSETKT